MILQSFDWIYYGLSDLKSNAGFRNSLHYLRLYDSKFDFTDELPTSSELPYSRWAAFFEGLIGCWRGAEISSREELVHAIVPSEDVGMSRRLLSQVYEMIDVFVVDIQSGKAVRLSSQLREDPDDDMDFMSEA